jgi:hypothetical protein
MRAFSYTSAGARSPTTARTGSIGITRPIRNVTSKSPSNVIAKLVSSVDISFAVLRAEAKIHLDITEDGRAETARPPVASAKINS